MGLYSGGGAYIRGAYIRGAYIRGACIRGAYIEWFTVLFCQNSLQSTRIVWVVVVEQIYRILGISPPPRGANAPGISPPL